ncbi:MAG: T9SS type A sorting domain-containing protein, partial [Ignavibacteria bacterium]
GNEINGLTMGGVGRETTIDHIEVFQNNDDGFEWFGGTVNCKYLVSSFNGDDGFDHDEGIRGTNQFLFEIQDANFGNHFGEHDGGTDPEDGLPYAFPQNFNATLLGSGMNSENPDNSYSFLLRDFWGGSYKNCIFGDYAGGAVNVEDLASGNDSRIRMENGQIVFNNNIWFNYADGITFPELVRAQPGSDSAFVSDYLSAADNNNIIEDPSLAGISRLRDGGLDPRPASASPAYQNLADYIVTGIRETANSKVVPNKYVLSQNYPNPFNPSTTIHFGLPEAGHVKLIVYNILGQAVTTLINGFRNSGTYNVTWNASNLTSGIYFYRIESGNFVSVKKMTLLK